MWPKHSTNVVQHPVSNTDGWSTKPLYTFSFIRMPTFNIFSILQSHAKLSNEFAVHSKFKCTEIVYIVITDLIILFYLRMEKRLPDCIIEIKGYMIGMKKETQASHSTQANIHRHTLTTIHITRNSAMFNQFKRLAPWFLASRLILSYQWFISEMAIASKFDSLSINYYHFICNEWERILLHWWLAVDIASSTRFCCCKVHFNPMGSIGHIRSLFSYANVMFTG